MEKNEIVKLHNSYELAAFNKLSENFELLPYFLFSSQEYNEIMKEKLKNGSAFELINELIFNQANRKIYLPFNSFYIDTGSILLSTDDDSVFSKLACDSSFYVTIRNNDLILYQFLKPLPYNDQLPKFILEQIIDINSIISFLIDKDNYKIFIKMTMSRTSNFLSQGKMDEIVSLDEDQMSQPLIRHIFNWAHGTTIYFILYFIEYLNSPKNYIVQKYNSKILNKSSEYILSKSHFLIIDKHSLKKSRDGKLFEINRNHRSGYLSSHFRRGYLRTYKHERFTKMKGELGFVKATWIGPKEWTGKDNKIYKIIDIGITRNDA
ncbi:hypothetical protein [Leptospira alexanderi]|uniref:Uncharacterized protein n=1 Tax=Leptospira alexanderi serovar Manhao 3 str. L 60 TaxID=1049759 RepID=V6I304_9LEPT|nr:hypothetical protein [Leptospira alexanderi]EQA64296.1 hypothetical protein LEP1GSC062_1887 [Leptospira alexanderi serovar Manhao 3 str. L 60]